MKDTYYTEWRPEKKSWTPLFFIGLITMGVLLALLALPTIVDRTINEPQKTSLIASITEDPDDYLGSSVTVQSEIENKVDRRGFTLDSETLTDESLLVISKQPLEAVGGAGDVALYNERDNVQVSGTVRRLNILEVERELGINLNEKDLAAWEGKPVIIANTVESKEQ